MVKTMAKIGMIGAGSWGTALTWLLTNNGHQVTVWSALADEITMLQEKHEQTSKLPGVILDDSVVFTTDLKAAVEGMDLLVLADVYKRQAFCTLGSCASKVIKLVTPISASSVSA